MEASPAAVSSGPGVPVVAYFRRSRRSWLSGATWITPSRWTDCSGPSFREYQSRSATSCGGWEVPGVGVQRPLMAASVTMGVGVGVSVGVGVGVSVGVAASAGVAEGVVVALAVGVTVEIDWIRAGTATLPSTSRTSTANTLTQARAGTARLRATLGTAGLGVTVGAATHSRLNTRSTSSSSWAARPSA